MKKLYLSLCLLFTMSLFGVVNAQNSSNKGKDFYVAYSGHIDGTASRLTLFLSADQSTTYEVYVGPNRISSGTISANTCLPVPIDPTIAAQNAYIGSSNVIEKNKAIRVITNNPISLYSIISNSARTGGTMVLPTNTLGKEYYAYCFQNKGTSASYSQITIVATENDTEIEITPTVAERNGGHPAGVAFTVSPKLMKGEIYQYQSVGNGDLSGSLVRSLNGCKPIAVFTGNTWAAFCEPLNPATPSGGDNLYQQMFPVSSWGKKFVTAPTFNSLNGNVEAFRIIVANDGTTVTVNGSTSNANGVPLANPYTKGSIITFYNNGPNVISATGPISVAQYQTSQSCNPSNTNNNNPAFPGDPEITLLNPIEQTLSNITVFSKLADVGVSTRVVNYYLNVIIKTADVASFRLDGNPVGNFALIADGEYSYAVIDVTSLQSQHRLTAAGGFSAIAYGLGPVESYAYLAGANIQDFTFQPLSAVTQQPITSGCLGEPIDLQINLPYKAASLEWFIQGQPAQPIISNPQESGTVVKDQVTYYTYTYPTQLQYNTPGTYQFRVIAEKPTADQCGNKEDLSVDFTVDSQPTAAFEPLVATCQASVVQFKDISTSNSPGRDIATWSWDFGDGSLPDPNQHPTHTYTLPGLYNVTLTVYTNTKCGTTSAAVPILINPKPEAKFQKTVEFCVNKDIVLDNISSIASGTITNYHWDFGNGQIFDLATPAFPPLVKYTTAGTKTITLTVTSDKGCISDVFSQQVEVRSLPIADFSMPGYCREDGDAVFKNLSTTDDGGTMTYIWDFGDGKTSIAVDGKNSYADPLQYTVTLRVFNQFGCEGQSKTQVFTVNPFVTAANFSIDNEANLCSSEKVIIHNTSTIASPGSIV
jgi:PKD repeat protein